VAHVTTGAIGSDVQGRAMIIHDYNGGRIACALLEPIRPLVQHLRLRAIDFVPYFNYGGNLVVSGSVGPMVTEGVTQSFSYSLEGVDPACESGAGTAGNSCGIHIHSGTTCAGDAAGHYYTGMVTSDPWTTVAYTSVSGTTAGVLSVTTGGTAADVVNRAMIIHAYNGGRIACALLAVYPDPSDVIDGSNSQEADEDVTFSVGAVVGIAIGAGIAGCLFGACIFWLVTAVRGGRSKPRSGQPKLVTSQQEADPRQVAVDMHLHSQLKKNQA